MTLWCLFWRASLLHVSSFTPCIRQNILCSSKQQIVIFSRAQWSTDVDTPCSTCLSCCVHHTVDRPTKFLHSALDVFLSRGLTRCSAYIQLRIQPALVSRRVASATPITPRRSTSVEFLSSRISRYPTFVGCAVKPECNAYMQLRIQPALICGVSPARHVQLRDGQPALTPLFLHRVRRIQPIVVSPNGTPGIGWTGESPANAGIWRVASTTHATPSWSTNVDPPFVFFLYA